MKRRDFIPLAAAGALSGWAGFVGGRKETPKRDAISAVAVQPAASYDQDLIGLLRRGFQSTGLQVEGKRVLLKPQVAAWPEPGQPANMHPANTHPKMLAAAFSELEELGAEEIRIGDAPEFERDTWALMEAAGYPQVIPNFADAFIDLHGDDLAPVAGFNRGELFFPDTALRADLVISLAKFKTDARYGAALSMTNLFGLIPGSVYGLRDPRQLPEGPGEDGYKLGTPRTVTELARFFQRSYAIVDGIVGWEGGAEGASRAGENAGQPKSAGVVVMGPDLVAADATSCRIMGISPSNVEYLALAADRQGVAAESRIRLVGDARTLTTVPFRPAA